MESEDDGMPGVLDVAGSVDGFWDNSYDMEMHDEINAFQQGSSPSPSRDSDSVLDGTGAAGIATSIQEEAQAEHMLLPTGSTVCSAGIDDHDRLGSDAESDAAEFNMSREDRFAAALDCRKTGKGVRPRQGCSSDRLNRESKEGTRALEFSGFFAVVRHTADAETARLHGYNVHQHNRPDFTRIEQPLLFAAQITDGFFGSASWQRAMSSITSKGFNEMQWLARSTIAQLITTSKRQLRQVPEKMLGQLESQAAPPQHLYGLPQSVQQQQQQQQRQQRQRQQQQQQQQQLLLKPDVQKQAMARQQHMQKLQAQPQQAQQAQLQARQAQLRAQQALQAQVAQVAQVAHQQQQQQQQQQQPPIKRQRGPEGGETWTSTTPGPSAHHPEGSASAAAGGGTSPPWDADLAIINPVALRSKIERCLTDFLRHPTTWTIRRHDGPNHLGVWYNVLPERQMALITSGCVLLQVPHRLPAAAAPGRSEPRLRGGARPDRVQVGHGLQLQSLRRIPTAAVS